MPNGLLGDHSDGRLPPRQTLQFLPSQTGQAGQFNPGVNFTNILQEASLNVSVLCSFNVWVCNFFWQKEISTKASCKILLKLTTGQANSYLPGQTGAYPSGQGSGFPFEEASQFPSALSPHKLSPDDNQAPPAYNTLNSI